jgi:hypothetical protein
MNSLREVPKGAVALDRQSASLSASNAQHVVERHYKNLAITNPASFGRRLDCGYNVIR